MITDGVEAHMAIVDTTMVRLVDVCLPYVMSIDGWTLWGPVYDGPFVLGIAEVSVQGVTCEGDRARQAISFLLKPFRPLLRRPCHGPCSPVQFLLPLLQIPGILAVLFPYRPHRDECCSPVAQRPDWWRGRHDLRGDSR